MVLFSVATMITVPGHRLVRKFLLSTVLKLTLEDDSTTKVDITSDSQVIQLDNIGDAANSLLELCHLLEITAQLDQWSGTETVGIDD